MASARISLAPAGGREVNWHLPGLTPHRAVQLLRTACAGEPGGKLFLSGRPVPAHAFWPVDADRPDGARFGWARQVQTLDRPLFERLVEALAPEITRRGLPPGPVEAEIFHGDYRQTPGGIHRESCSNIHLVVAGTKTMHFWPSTWPPPGTPRRADVADGAGTPEEYLPDLDPQDVLADARTSTQTTGGGFHWPAGTWHVARTIGEATALNIAMYHLDLSREDGLPVWDGTLHGPVPAAWLDRCRRHLGGRLPVAEVLAHVSALGMRPAPATRQPRPIRRAVIRLDVPVLSTAQRDGMLLATLGAWTSLPVATALDWLPSRPLPGTVFDVPAGAARIAGWLYGQGVLDIAEER